MLPLEYDIEAYQGDTWGFQFAFTESDNTTVKDVSASVFQMQVRETPDSGATLLEISTTTGEITFGVDLYLNITVPAALMEIEAGNWYYDIQQVDGTTVQTKLSGRFKVDAEVTR